MKRWVLGLLLAALASSSGSARQGSGSTLIIHSPQDQAVVQGDLFLSATCTTPGCTIAVYNQSGTPLAASTGSELRQIVSRSLLDNGNGYNIVSFRVGGTSVPRFIYLDSSAYYSEIAKVQGSVWDFDATRVLFIGLPAGCGACDNRASAPSDVKIVDRQTEAETTITTMPFGQPGYGYLTPSGAMFAIDSHVFEWRNSTLTDRGGDPTRSLVVSGKYATWNAGPLGRSQLLEDTDIGVVTTVAAGDVMNNSNNVGPNGDAVYAAGSPYRIFRYRAGTTTAIPHGGDPALCDFGPVTDGANIAYARIGCSGLQPSQQIVLYADAQETILASDTAPSVTDLQNGTMSLRLEPHRGYESIGGWIAFTAHTTSKIVDIWLRSPAGVVSQVSSGGSTTIEALDDAGRVAFIRLKQTFVTQPAGASPLGIGSELGRTVFRNGKAFRILGGTIFEVLSAPVPLPTLSASPTAVSFGVARDASGAVSTATPPRTITLTKANTRDLDWTAEVDKPWLTVTPISGSGSGAVSVGISSNTSGLPTSGSVSGTLTIKTTNAANTILIPVTVTVYPNGTSLAPFGTIDTPLQNAAGLSGAVPFSGWALDDVGVNAVSVCRAAVSGEAAPVDSRCGGSAQIFVGNTVFVEGARPDVQNSYPGYPNASRAGWGLMVLTNVLPGGGNGSYTFFAYATDADGHTTTLGSRTIGCDNAHSTRPFGTIDTPAQGAVISGSSYAQFGWALTPQPKQIPFDGSTITVYIDGVSIGSPSYNNFRSDIAAAFPGLKNSGGAVGLKVLDTTTLSNGLHTIGWFVTDSAGASDGIGSRFFSVLNSGSSQVAAAKAPPSAAALANAGSDSPPQTITGEELSRFEVALGVAAGQTLTGFLRAGGRLERLPIGSHLDPDTGTFSWQLGPGFIGTYDVVFVRSAGGQVIGKTDVRFVVTPKTGTSSARLVIDTPSAGRRVDVPFLVGGWALDLKGARRERLDTVYAWAWPTTGGAPTFLGMAPVNGSRPDVAFLFGPQFRSSGYGLIVDQLAPGTYDVAVFGRSSARDAYLVASSVRITVR